MRILVLYFSDLAGDMPLSSGVGLVGSTFRYEYNLNVGRIKNWHSILMLEWIGFIRASCLL